MATVKRFYELDVWKKARILNVELNKLLLEKINKRDFILMDQMRRASISVMANMAEGFGRKGNREFFQFLAISHGSLTELQSHLYIALDLNYFNPSDFEKINLQIEEVFRMLNGLMDYLSKSGFKGIKYS